MKGYVFVRGGLEDGNILVPEEGVLFNYDKAFNRMMKLNAEVLKLHPEVVNNYKDTVIKKISTLCKCVLNEDSDYTPFLLYKFVEIEVFI